MLDRDGRHLRYPNHDGLPGSRDRGPSAHRRRHARHSRTHPRRLHDGLRPASPGGEAARDPGAPAPMIGRLALLLAIALPALYLACSSDSDNGTSGSPSGTPSLSFSPRDTFAPGETKTATPSPPPPSAGETPGPPPAPAFSSGVSKTAEGVLGFTLLPGVKNSFDPIVFPADPGLQQPPCPQFVFAFGWT